MQIFPKIFSEKFSVQTILEIMFLSKNQESKNRDERYIVVVGSSKVTVF